MLRRKRLGSAALLFMGFGVASTSQEALADGPSQLQVTTAAIPICALSPAATSGASTNASYASNTITLTQLIDPTTALVNQASLTLQIANAICNNNAWFSLRSQNGGLTSSTASSIAPGSGGFLTVIPYTASATWGSLNVTLDTSTGAHFAGVPTGGAYSGSLSLNVATQKSTLPVVQGTYSDVLTVRVRASF